MTEKNDLKVLAAKYGLSISDEIVLNDIGLDFRVAFATAQNGVRWVLRLPRRKDMLSQIERESKILLFLKKHLHISVPDWNVVSSELVAYPLLPDSPALSVDSVTHEMLWNISLDSQEYVTTLAQSLVSLHGVDVVSAKEVGLKFTTSAEARRQISDEINRVKSELGINLELERKLKAWIDNDKLWPDFSVLVHGDLYAGHILTKKSGMVTGMIDWSEAQIADPSIDFAGHLTVFGEESLRKLISEYEKAGGRTWPHLFHQTKERSSASPLKFAIFALDSGDDQQVEAARQQLHGPT